MNKLNEAVEHHPMLATLFSIFSFLAGAAQWLVDHADAFTKLTGFAATLLGVAAGWYAFRINRRKWQRIQRGEETE